MATLPGRCDNEMFCPVGASGAVVQVPADGPFVCPQCGKVLLSPSRARRRARRAWFGGAMAVVMAMAFAAGMVLGAGRLLR